MNVPLIVLAILSVIGLKLGITSKEKLYLAILKHVACPLVQWGLKKGTKYCPEEAKSLVGKLIADISETAVPADPVPEEAPEEPVKKTTAKAKK